MSHETVDRVVSCPKAATDMGQALEKVIASVKKSLDDGFQPGMDIPVIITSAISELIAPVKELGALGIEADEDMMGVAQTLAISGFEIAKLFKKAPAAPAPQAAAPSA